MKTTVNPWKIRLFIKYKQNIAAKVINAVYLVSIARPKINPLRIVRLMDDLSIDSKARASPVSPNARTGISSMQLNPGSTAGDKTVSHRSLVSYPNAKRLNR